MAAARLQELYDRLRRLDAVLGDNSSKKGLRSTAPMPPEDRAHYGESVTYIMPGQLSHEEYVDRVESMLDTIGKLKTHLEVHREDHGLEREPIQEAFRQNMRAAVCIDLYNRGKHPDQDRSATGLFPRLDIVTINITLLAKHTGARNLQSIERRVGEVEIEVKDPSLSEYLLPVFDQNGDELGDVTVFLQAGIELLENLAASAGVEDR